VIIKDGDKETVLFERGN
jgi:hypothetical protein